jgi:hypothetical protein
MSLRLTGSEDTDEDVGDREGAWMEGTNGGIGQLSPECV